MWSQISAIRSCVVHMNVRMPSSWAMSSTSMIAWVSWKRMACARAFSSDMWFTPKNWLSPKSSRSIVFRSPYSVVPAAISACAEEQAAPAPGRGGSGGGSGGMRRGPGTRLGVGDDHRDHAIGHDRVAEGILVARGPGLDAAREVIELGRILLATDVEPHGLRQLGGVAHVPARLVAL